MSKVSRSVQAGFARNARKMKLMMDRKKAAKSEDRLGLLRNRRLFNPLPWKIAPLEGKYYGTSILDANGDEIYRIWTNRNDPEANPSTRELATLGPFESDAERDAFWKEYWSDNHYESVRDLAIAEFIIAAVNAHHRN